MHIYIYSRIYHAWVCTYTYKCIQDRTDSTYLQQRTLAVLAAKHSNGLGVSVIAHGMAYAWCWESALRVENDCVPSRSRYRGQPPAVYCR